LLGALVPVLIHRLRRTDPIERPFPAFALLARAQAAHRRARGLTDLPLLIVRAALLAVCALALTAPFVLAATGFGDGRVAATAIVIDDSMSMGRTEGLTTPFANAVARARDAIDALPEGSEAAIVLSGKPARVAFGRSGDLVRATQLLDDMPGPDARANDFVSALDLARQQLGASQLRTRRMLVLSDFDAAAKFPEGGFEGIDTFVERVGDTEQTSNRWITDVRVQRDEDGKSVVEVDVAAVAVSDGPIEVVIERSEREIARGDAELSAGQGTARIVLPDRDANAAGDTTLQVRLSGDDALALDDVAGAVLDARDAIEVLLVNGDPHPTSQADELHFVTRALSVVPTSAGRARTRSTDADALVHHDLAGVDVVVLANVGALDATVNERVRAFVEAGGGLVVTAGDNLASRDDAAGIASLLPARIVTFAGGTKVGFAATPPSQTLAHGSQGLDAVKVSKRLVLDANDDDVALRFTDESPAVVSGDVGDGRVVQLALPLDADWSDLPLRPGFVTLTWSVVRAAARAASATSAPEAPGAPAMVAMPPGAEQLEVVAPDGQRHPLATSGDTATFNHTALAGAYRVLASSGSGAPQEVPRAAFVVRAPVEESPLVMGPVPKVSAPAGSRAHAVSARRPIAPVLFILCAALALAEGLLRNRKRR
jgi:hypothetical protein